MPRRRKSVRLYQRKDDGAWVILDSGKQKRTGYGEGFRAEAEEALARYINEKSSRDIVKVQPDQISVGEVLVCYGEERLGQVKDPERLLNSITALSPYWADKLVSEVTHDSCVGYTRWRKKAPWTMRREMGTLNAALKLAAARSRIPYAPIVTLPPKGQAKDRWLTEDEVSRLLSQSESHVRRFIRIALATGRRKGAILGLKWVQSIDSGWVDLDRGVIHFLGKAEEETKKRKGVVRIPSKLLEEMKQWDQDCEYVISRRGTNVQDIKKAFNGATQRAGLTDVTPHSQTHRRHVGAHGWNDAGTGNRLFLHLPRDLRGRLSFL